MFRFACLLILLLKNTRAEECDTTETEDSLFHVYYGWPFTYSCLSIFDSIDYPYDLEDYGEYTCIMTDMKTGNVIFNTSFSGSLDLRDFDIDKSEYRFENITLDTPTSIITNLQNASYCWIENVTLAPTYLVDESCKENLNKSQTNDIEKVVGSIFQGVCEVPRGSGLPLELVGRTDGAKFYWLYNCNSILPSNTNKRTNDDDLYFTNISYQSNPGVYTCVVEHNNVKRYRIHTRICVRERTSRQMSLSCVNQRVAIGDDVEIECDVDAGVGRDNSLIFFARLNKLNATGDIDSNQSDLSCIAQAEEDGRTSPNNRGFCQLTLGNIRKDDVDCFYRQPTEEELKNQRTTFKFIYRIKNVQKSDFGTYEASITRASTYVFTNTFNITYDRTPALNKSNVLLIVAVSVVLGFILFLIMLCVLCGVEVRWVWFRMFAAKEEGVKRYSAYMAYYYRDEMPQTNTSKFRTFVMDLTREIEENGGNVYDDCKEISHTQYKAESIFLKLSECHRVVIILTPEYINDEWSVSEAYAAWKHVIEEGIKIIFITFSETKSAIANLKEEPRNCLNKALKRHKVIRWDGSSPLTKRFCMQFEMCMPKLPNYSPVELEQTTHSNGDIVTKPKHYGLLGHNPTTPEIDTNGNIYENTLENVL